MTSNNNDSDTAHIRLYGIDTDEKIQLYFINIKVE